jgi:hypothetical protein
MVSQLNMSGGEDWQYNHLCYYNIIIFVTSFLNLQFSIHRPLECSLPLWHVCQLRVGMSCSRHKHTEAICHDNCYDSPASTLQGPYCVIWSNFCLCRIGLFLLVRFCTSPWTILRFSLHIMYHCIIAYAYVPSN